MIRGKHTLQVGGQYEFGLDNYYQTNIASGAFGFGGVWTSSTGGANLVTNTQAAFADFLLGLSENQGTFVNQTEGAAQVPALTAGKQTYRALYVDDTWHARSKLTLNIGLRYELPGTWSERYNRLSYWDPNATNATVTAALARDRPARATPSSWEPARTIATTTSPWTKRRFRRASALPTA